ncbi:hypothetical protein N0V88_008065 [Collariella sp. IMI 366227]|nr:hypothetical protein N0V88_008065 [Collariella sp. IMI 366227]
MCISQNDLADKIAHIASMDLIYRSARRIAILLEDIQLDKNEEEAGLAYAGFYADLCREIKNAGLEGAEKAWCAHESRMTRHQKVNNPLFLCFGSGGRVISFEFRFIHYLGLYLSSKEPQDFSLGLDAKAKINDPNPVTLRQRWWRIQRLMPDVGQTDSALQHLVSILAFGCFLKRDLISIALNTGGIPLSFDGEDIQCVEEAIWRFALLVLASGDLVPFVASGSKLWIAHGERRSISWLPKPDQGVMDDELPNPLPKSITAVTREYIELDLLVFEAMPKQASPESQDKATCLISKHNLNGLADQHFTALGQNAQTVIRSAISAMMRITPNSDISHVCLHRYLSLAIDNGLNWILDFPRIMRKITSDAWLHGIIGDATDPNLAPAARTLLAFFNQPTTTPDGNDTDLVARATRSLTTLINPCLLLFTPSPRLLPLSPSLGTAALTPGTSNKSYVAVPAALAHLPGHYERAWVLEPFDPVAPPERLSDMLPPANLRIVKDGEKEDGRKIEDVMPVLNSDYEDRRAARDDVRRTWRLRRRQAVFGCPGRVWAEEGKVMLDKGDVRLEGGEGLVLLRKQRVYGAEDYPWGEIHAAMQKVVAEAGKELG